MSWMEGVQCMLTMFAVSTVRAKSSLCSTLGISGKIYKIGMDSLVKVAEKHCQEFGVETYFRQFMTLVFQYVCRFV